METKKTDGYAIVRTITSIIYTCWLTFSPFLFLGMVIYLKTLSDEVRTQKTHNYVKITYSEGPLATSHIKLLSSFEPMDIPMDDELQEFLHWVCLEKEVDPNLVLAIIEHESNFVPSAISSTDDYGLMQINIVNHEWMKKEWGITDFLDPYQNIIAGVGLLDILKNRYDGNYEKVLLSYAVGEGGAKNLWENGIYSTKATREIVDLKDKYDGRTLYGKH